MPTELTKRERDSLANKWVEAWQDDELSFDALVKKLTGLKEATIVENPKEDEDED
jgi:hypothetical protein